MEMLFWQFDIWSSNIAIFTVLLLSLFWVLRRFYPLNKRKPPPCFNVSLVSFYYLFSSILRYDCSIPKSAFVIQAIQAHCLMTPSHGLFRFFIMMRNAIMLFNYKTVEAVLGSHTLIEKSKEYKILHVWLGTGLLTSGGEKWQYRRKLLTPAFHFRILENFVSVFNSQSTILLKILKEEAKKEWTDIVPLVTMCTLDIICESTMGVSINAQTEPENKYVQSLKEISALFIDRITNPFLWTDTAFGLSSMGRKFKKKVEIVQNFTRKVIKSKKEELLLRMKHRSLKDNEKETDGTKKKKALLELLLDLHMQNESFTEEDIREEVDTFMFEGHDTTAMAINWTLYNVGLCPDIQEKIISEIDEIFGGDKDRPVTAEDIKGLKYLTCALKESLRLYPSVPVIAREATEDLEILGFHIPRGSLLAICPYVVHRDSTVFPNPEVFDPDRFLPEACVGRNPYAYIPFSAGPRNCIGQRFALMEEKTVLANVFRNFTVKSLDHRDKIHILGDIILRSAGPLRMKIMPR